MLPFTFVSLSPSYKIKTNITLLNKLNLDFKRFYLFYRKHKVPSSSTWQHFKVCDCAMSLFRFHRLPLDLDLLLLDLLLSLDLDRLDFERFDLDLDLERFERDSRRERDEDRSLRLELEGERRLGSSLGASLVTSAGMAGAAPSGSENYRF